MLEKFFSNDTMGGRLARTIAQGILSVAIVAVPALVSTVVLDPFQSSVLTALIMAILSPVFYMFKTGNPEDGLVDKTEDTSTLEVKDEKNGGNV